MHAWFAAPKATIGRLKAQKPNRPPRLPNPGIFPTVYLAKGMTTNIPADYVLLYDHPDNHHDRGINILLADFSVTWLNEREAQAFFASLKTGQPAIWPLRTVSASQPVGGNSSENGVK